MVRERSERPEEQVAENAQTGGVPRKAASPINWWKLDAEERTEIISILMEWVPQLVRRYGLPEQIVPPCWYRHEALIQELLALFQYRNQQQYMFDMPPGGPLEFHTQLQLVIGRLRFWVSFTECTLGRHEETVIPAWAGQQIGEWAADALVTLEDTGVIVRSD